MINDPNFYRPGIEVFLIMGACTIHEDAQKFKKLYLKKSQNVLNISFLVTSVDLWGMHYKKHLYKRENSSWKEMPTKFIRQVILKI